MNPGIINFLKLYSTNEDKVNSLIVSAFIAYNELAKPKNNLLKKYIIDGESKHKKHLSQFNLLLEKCHVVFDFEFLIELFEFIISPKDKIVNGAVYTPKYVREHITLEVLKSCNKGLENIRACDLSVGCGGFLFSLSKIIKVKTGRTFYSIFKNNIYGLDITPYSIVRSKILLSLLALSENEDSEEFNFNLDVGNALDFQWREKHQEIETNNGFDIILGNPPYVCSRNINLESLKLLKNWRVCSTGHPDLYIPFFQIGAENLSPDGTLGFITVNTFMKSINGRALRFFFSEKKLALRIINFAGEQIFKDRNTYTCLCFLKNKIGGIEYMQTKSSALTSIPPSGLQKYTYEELNNEDGWNLVNSAAIAAMVKRVETTGVKFKDTYVTRNGIATLKNDIYIFKPFRSSKKYFYLMDGDEEVRIERAICRNIVNSNTVKTPSDLRSNREKIIFPFKQVDGEIAIIREATFKRRFPSAYEYLKRKREILGTRDKGKAKKDYEIWYDYGRRQSLDIKAYKLFFPHICEKPTFLLSRNKNLLFYNGIAVISNDFRKLELLKRVLESSIFFDYVQQTTKNYSSGFISLSKNYIKNFGVPQLTRDEETKLLSMTDVNEINRFLAPFYSKPHARNNGHPIVTGIISAQEVNERRKLVGTFEQ